MHRILKEFLLVFVLLFDILIHIFIASFLILNEVVELIVHCHFQLLMVVNVLDYLEHSIFEVFNDMVVVSYDISVRSDCLEDECLSDAEVFNHKTKTCIDFVVLFKSCVH